MPQNEVTRSRDAAILRRHGEPGVFTRCKTDEAVDPVNILVEHDVNVSGVYAEEVHTATLITCDVSQVGVVEQGDTFAEGGIKYRVVRPQQNDGFTASFVVAKVV